MKNTRTYQRTWWTILVAFGLFGLAGCGSGFKAYPPGSVISLSPTNVALYPLTTEDLAGPCTFDLLLQEPTIPQMGTFVIYERGDSRTLYDDKTLQAAALSLHYAMVWAHECDSTSTGTFQADAGKGPSRVLFAALDQFAVNTGRPELATGGVALYGFSAAGVLVATMANEHPDRLLGNIEYASGDTFVNLETVPISAAAAQIPTLILANGKDAKAGTQRTLDYFRRGRNTGATWAFGVQHATNHCCTLSTRDVVLPWLKALALAHSNGSSSGTATAPTHYPGEMYTEFTCSLDKTTDAQGYSDCEFSAANLLNIIPSTGLYGWLPDQASASAWLVWVLSASTNQAAAIQKQQSAVVQASVQTDVNSQ